MMDYSPKLFICLFVYFIGVFQADGRLIYVVTNDGHIGAVEAALFEYPGTKWCGPGNTAKNHDDLGVERDTDLCCRDHDDCPEYIEGRHSKYGLTNNAFYTRLSCSCDQQFYTCLKDNVAKNSTSISYKVGHVYFDLLGTQCYAKDHPIIGCEEHYKNSKRCLHYKLDETRDAVWQWYDEPLFNED